METIKSHERRLNEGWYQNIQTPGIDIGCGTDVVHPEFRRWDRMHGDGDATFMEGVPDESYQTVYASHVLEHLDEPEVALSHWWRILKPGGMLIVVVPHRDLYEKKLTLPSNWNGEHKFFWLPEVSEEPCTRSFLEVLGTLDGVLEMAIEVLDKGWESDGADSHSRGEFSIEGRVIKA